MRQDKTKRTFGQQIAGLFGLGRVPDALRRKLEAESPLLYVAGCGSERNVQELQNSGSSLRVQKDGIYRIRGCNGETVCREGASI